MLEVMRKMLNEVCGVLGYAISRVTLGSLCFCFCVVVVVFVCFLVFVNPIVFILCDSCSR